jgi:opacity protein-like surface antigen
VTETALPKDGNWENYYGVGPVAGKVYRKDSGLSIGGYGEVLYQYNSSSTEFGFEGEAGSPYKNPSPGPNQGKFDMLRAVLYVGYKFSDKWVLNSEIEFEHGGKSDVYVEFLNLDYQATEELNFRVGLILNPMGFVNQIHEPTFYYGAQRPEVEQRMIPTTWREMGGGVYGRIADRVSYQAYAMVSLDGQDFNAEGYRGGRQKGIKSTANNWSFTARADVDIISGLMAGGSIYTGHQGQNQGVGNLQMTMYELHTQFKRFGFTGRALFAQSFIDDPSKVNAELTSTLATVDNPLLATESLGWYVEGAYDIFSLLMPDSRQSLEPYIRYSQVNTQRAFQGGVNAPSAEQLANGQRFNNEIITVGLQYKPIPQVVFKLDYRYEKTKETDVPIQKLVQVGVGYVF